MFNVPEVTFFDFPARGILQTIRDRSLFMAGVGAEEKLFLAQNFFLPNHCQTENSIYPTVKKYNFFSTQPLENILRYREYVMDNHEFLTCLYL